VLGLGRTAVFLKNLWIFSDITKNYQKNSVKNENSLTLYIVRKISSKKWQLPEYKG
jgi:hypothetical protein